MFKSKGAKFKVAFGYFESGAYANYMQHVREPLIQVIFG
jgi:hypothetical protein